MNIIIVGDVMLDINKKSKIVRHAPEADIPIYNILDVNYILGGAANVCQNLKNLGANVEIISVIGDDNNGNKIIEMLHSRKISHKLFVDKARDTTQKNRIFVDNKLSVRFDIETNADIPKNIEKEIIDYIVTKDQIDAIIITDYDKGVITEYLSQTLISYANENNILTFVDPKLNNYMKYYNCFLFKPNQHEAEIISGEKDVEKMITNIKQKINCENVLLTIGKKGMVLNDIYNKIEHTSLIPIVDVTGAGDIVLAILVYVYLKKRDLLLASKVANFIGGKSVGVIGNYNVSQQDIEEYFETSKQKINEINDKIIFDYEIERIKQIKQRSSKKMVFTNGCFDILHSAHIELLQFSKKQGEILVIGLNADESIRRLKGDRRPINDIDERAKILSLFDFVDYIIVFTDDTPFNIIESLRPDILVKGSDYKKENIVGKEFVKDIVLFDYIPNKSSSQVIHKIKNNPV